MNKHGGHCGEGSADLFECGKSSFRLSRVPSRHIGGVEADLGPLAERRVARCAEARHEGITERKGWVPLVETRGRVHADSIQLHMFDVKNKRSPSLQLRT
jgi:hypothetical protein